MKDATGLKTLPSRHARRRLLVLPRLPIQRMGNRVRIDAKFISGMEFYCQSWDGEVACVLNESDEVLPFSTERNIDELPFTLHVLPPGGRLMAGDFQTADVVLCAGDSHVFWDIPDLSAGLDVRIYYVIEYVLETRFQIIWLDPKAGISRKLRSSLWTLREEYRRHRAFRKAAGLQANGAPAKLAYHSVNPNTLLYFDNRTRAGMLATPEEMAARRRRLMSGGRLRLIHSGRLEAMKGAQDLLPVMRYLLEAGLDASLDVFGTGSLEPGLRAEIRREGLQDRVRLHGAVDFETELVPFARREADIYLSCHRQSDPSCTYVESMGCGLPIVGYDNRMWRNLCESSGAGWTAPLGRPKALARALLDCAKDRAEIMARADAALEFARQHVFETEFARRLEHLAKD